MWPKEYKDYKKDRPLKAFQVEPCRGIVGCEMHDLNGWGNSLHREEPFRIEKSESSPKEK